MPSLSPLLLPLAALLLLLASTGPRAAHSVPAAAGAPSANSKSASIDELRRLLAPLRPPSAVAPPAAAPSVMAKVAQPSDSSSSHGELRPPTLDDLRSGIIRALVSDAAAVSLDKPGVWPAVRDFVRLLNSHLSARSLELGRLLRPLAAWLPEEPPSHDRWLRALADAGFPTRPPDAWVSCRGSKPFLRGYPCSLWQLFHTLTAVRFATAGASGPPVMPVMRRFIIACFSCRYCAENFDKGTAGMEAEIGAQPAPGVELLYLWRKHNTVNKRLSGESSDDPAYPKARFPSAALCSECAEGAASADANAAAFLLRWYWPGAGWASHPEFGFTKPAIVTVDIMGFFRLDLFIVALCFACVLDALLVVCWCRLSRSGRRLCRRDLSPFRRSPSPVF